MSNIHAPTATRLSCHCSDQRPLKPARRRILHPSPNVQNLTGLDSSVCHPNLARVSPRIPEDLHRKKKVRSTLPAVCASASRAHGSHSSRSFAQVQSRVTAWICPSREEIRALWAEHSELTSAPGFPGDNFHQSAQPLWPPP